MAFGIGGNASNIKRPSRVLQGSTVGSGNGIASNDGYSNFVRRLKRMFLPLHRTCKRFMILSGCGIIVFLVYMQLVDVYLRKLRTTQDFKPLRINNWHQNGQVGNNVSKLQYGFSEIYITPNSAQKPSFFLILTCSSPWDTEHRSRRAAIRQTWANCEALNEQFAAEKTIDPAKQVFCHQIFFLGRTFDRTQDDKLLSEASQFNDILVSDVYDNYRNITYKLLSALRWASTQRFKFLIKTDDDVYINLPNLYNWLDNEKRSLPKDLYGGVTYNGDVVRDRNHKHYVSVKDFSEPWYPTYCKGSLYMLSGHVVPKLVKASTGIKRFNIDDAYIGLVLNSINVFPVAIHRFIQFKYMYLAVDLLHNCDLGWILGLGDSLKPSQLFALQDKFSRHSSHSLWMCFNVHPFLFGLGLTISIISVLVIVLRHRY